MDKTGLCDLKRGLKSFLIKNIIRCSTGSSNHFGIIYVAVA